MLTTINCNCIFFF